MSACVSVARKKSITAHYDGETFRYVDLLDVPQPRCHWYIRPQLVPLYGRESQDDVRHGLVPDKVVLIMEYTFCEETPDGLL